MTEMGIETTILDSILNGQKTIECRLRTPKFVTLRAGDIVSLRRDTWQTGRLVSSITNAAKVRVIKTQFFDTFDAAFESIDYKQVVPTADSAHQAIAEHRHFYTSVQEHEHGVVAISFTLQ